MSYLNINHHFNEFLNNFAKSDLDKVFDYLKFKVHTYEQDPHKFINYMFSDKERHTSEDASKDKAIRFISQKGSEQIQLNSGVLHEKASCSQSNALAIKAEPDIVIEKSFKSRDSRAKLCQVCEVTPARGKNSGVYVCRSCELFFHRSINTKSSFEHSAECLYGTIGKDKKCRKCRIEKCTRLGLENGLSQLANCQICNAKASGIHYGVASCYQCAHFFYVRNKYQTKELVCKNNNNCSLNDASTSRLCTKCRYDRFQELSNKSFSFLKR